MTAFTLLNPKGSRFSVGSDGVYCAETDLQKALCEAIYPFENFARDAANPHREKDMRVLLGTAHTVFHDIAMLGEAERARGLHTNRDVTSQIFAMALRNRGSNGIDYPSVRNRRGTCLAAFRPKAVGIPHQERHGHDRWNGNRVDRSFDFNTDQWIEIPPAR